MSSKLKILLAFLTLLSAAPLRAEESDQPSAPAAMETQNPVYTLEEVDIYGDRLGVSDKSLSKDAIQDIKDTGEISGSLDRESGLETQGEGQGKTWTTLAIRGQSFRETVVLVNGVRMPESFNLGTIPTENIEKIEVLSGPQALAYDSEAVGGVINITTRQAENNPFNFQVSGGAFNTYQFQGSTPSFGPGDFQNTLSGSWYTTDGYAGTIDTPAGPVTFTDEIHWDASHVATLNLPGDKVSLSTSFFRAIGSAPDADNIVAAGTDQYDLDGRQDAWGLQSTLRDVHAMGAWKMTPSLFGNYSDVLRSNPFGGDVSSGTFGPYHNQYLNFGGQVYVSGPANDFLPLLSLGLEVRDEDLWSGLYGNRTRKVASLVASGTLKFADSLHLDLTNRAERYSDYDWVDNPVGTLVYSPSKDVKIHLGGGLGYKVPSYDELYLPSTDFNDPSLQGQFRTPNNPDPGMISPASFGQGEVGNPGLKPEKSINTELGTEITLGAMEVDLSGFANIYQDLINPGLNPVTFWTYVNIDHALFAGTEDSVKVRLTDWLAPYASFTWIKATDQDNNDIPGRLRTKFAFGADFKPESRWSLNINGRYIERNPLSEAELNDLGQPPEAVPYWDLNATARYTISDHLKGFITVDNILNTEMATFQAIPLRGRYLESGLQAAF